MNKNNDEMTLEKFKELDLSTLSSDSAPVINSNLYPNENDKFPYRTIWIVRPEMKKDRDPFERSEPFDTVYYQNSLWSNQPEWVAYHRYNQ